MVAMVNATKGWVVVVASLVAALTGFRSLAGPSFYNGSDTPIELYVITDDDAVVHLLTHFEPHSLFTQSEARVVKAMKVVVLSKEYQIDKSEATREVGDIRVRDQLWVFDGTRICVVRNRAFDVKAGLQCANELGSRK
jgi:hypothetical protein